MKLIASAPLIDDGRIALFLRGKLVWFGMRSEPWEDVQHDVAFVSVRDFEQLERALGGSVPSSA